MKESFEEGAVVSHVAQRHGLSPQQLFGWRREIRDLVLGDAGPEREEPPVRRRFVPIAVARAAPIPGVMAMATNGLAVPNFKVRIEGQQAQAVTAV